MMPVILKSMARPRPRLKPAYEQLRATNAPYVSQSALQGRRINTIKGQLTILLPQAEVDYITVGPNDLYMFPRRDGILLGGTHEEGNWTLEADAEAAQRILQGHMRVFREMA